MNQYKDNFVTRGNHKPLSHSSDAAHAAFEDIRSDKSMRVVTGDNPMVKTTKVLTEDFLENSETFI